MKEPRQRVALVMLAVLAAIGLLGPQIGWIDGSMGFKILQIDWG